MQQRHLRVQAKWSPSLPPYLRDKVAAPLHRNVRTYGPLLAPDNFLLTLRGLDKVRLTDFDGVRDKVGAATWDLFIGHYEPRRDNRPPRLIWVGEPGVQGGLLLSTHVAYGGYKKVHLCLDASEKFWAFTVLRVGELGAVKSPDNRTRVSSASSCYSELIAMHSAEAPILLRSGWSPVRFPASGKVGWLFPWADCDVGELVSAGKPQPHVGELLLVQGAEALASLDAISLVHCDLRLENVLACRDGTLRLGDYGRMCWLSQEWPQQSILGSYRYMPPEIFAKMPSTPGQHRWSLGICTLEVMRGHRLFVQTPDPDTSNEAAERRFCEGVAQEVEAFVGWREQVIAADFDLTVCPEPAWLVNFFAPLFTQGIRDPEDDSFESQSVYEDATSVVDEAAQGLFNPAVVVTEHDDCAAFYDASETFDFAHAEVARWVFEHLLHSAPACRADPEAIRAFAANRPSHLVCMLEGRAVLRNLPVNPVREAISRVMRAARSLPLSGASGGGSRSW